MSPSSGNHNLFFSDENVLVTEDEDLELVPQEGLWVSSETGRIGHCTLVFGFVLIRVFGVYISYFIYSRCML